MLAIDLLFPGATTSAARDSLDSSSTTPSKRAALAVHVDDSIQQGPAPFGLSNAAMSPGTASRHERELERHQIDSGVRRAKLTASVERGLAKAEEGEKERQSLEHELSLEATREIEEDQEQEGMDDSPTLVRSRKVVPVAAPSGPPTQSRTSSIASSVVKAFSRSRPSSVQSGASLAAGSGGQSIKPRPVPATNKVPSSQPRLTKTAALRLGVDLPPSPRAQAVQSKVDDAMPVPKNRRISVVVPKSLSQPSIVPRSNKAAALRVLPVDASTSVETRSLPKVRETSTTAQRSQNHRLENAPGHNSSRRESIVVASTAAPTILVRGTKTSAIRTGEPVLPTAGSRSKASSVADAASTAGVRESAVAGGEASRTSSRASAASTFSRRSTISSFSKPKIEPRLDKTTKLRLGLEVEPKRRQSSVVANYDGGQSSSFAPAGFRADDHAVPGFKRRESLAPTVVKPPSITPRLNRSVLLRQGNEDPMVSPMMRRASMVPALPAGGLEGSKIASGVGNGAGLVSQRVSAAERLRLPTIVPRMNRTEELRAKKKEEELEAVRKASLASKRVTRPTTSAGPTGGRTGAARPLGERNE